ncbi:MAG: hypothetical protein ABH967_02205, partial [Patescibacteria group bacterium]
FLEKFMKSKISKTEVRNKIEKFFSNIKNKTPKEIKKIKRLAMKYKVPLKEKRKLFCKKCLVAYSGKEKVRIKNNHKIITCSGCKYVSKWKL